MCIRDRYCDLNNAYFVIWTTTTWTLPGNLAISLNANFDYDLIRVPNGEVYIMAKDLKEKVLGQAGIEQYEVLATLPGSEFELMTAQHPFLDRESVIITGEHVTLDAGTGCVHTAPGFGADDYLVCKQWDETGKTHIGIVAVSYTHLDVYKRQAQRDLCGTWPPDCTGDDPGGKPVGGDRGKGICDKAHGLPRQPQLSRCV